MSYDPERHDTASVDASAERNRNMSIADLVRQLTDQGRELASQQVDLVKVEVRSTVEELKVAAAELVGALVVGVAGLGVVLMGLAFGLGLLMPLWIAMLLVGALALGAGFAMYRAAADKLNTTKIAPEATKRTLERAPGAISGDESKGLDR